MRRKKVGILISGRGSNMAALIDASRAKSYPAEIVLVISNRDNAPGLRYAGDNGIAQTVIDHRDFAEREAFDNRVDKALREAEVEIVCLAGFMRILSKEFVSRWKDRLINIHPSLLPAFKGLHIHDRVLDSGIKITGCTVHYIRAEMDEGPVIAQAAVPVLETDDAESLAARVLVAEHRLYPLALALVAAGRARVTNERVIITGAGDGGSEAGSMVLVNPPET